MQQRSAWAVTAVDSAGWPLLRTVHEIGHFQKILLQITGFLMGVSFVLVGIALSLLLSRLGLRCDRQNAGMKSAWTSWTWWTW